MHNPYPISTTQNIRTTHNISTSAHGSGREEGKPTIKINPAAEQVRQNSKTPGQGCNSGRVGEAEK
jgi:hypothetical protein